MELNNSQLKAVMKKEGPCMVLAGPGSGKTAVLTRRVIELIKSGVPAEEILVITFTKAAAIEMKERFDRLSDDIYPVTFGTFHSLFWGILKKEMNYKTSDILMGSYRNKVLLDAMRLIDKRFDDNSMLGIYSAELSAFYNSAKSILDYEPKIIEKDDLIQFLKAYESLKRKYHVVDFDDMLTKTYRLFNEKPDVLKRWQKKFSFFLVDEMQDMNDIQFELMNMLSQRTRNIFCVGDDDQSIYGFRGANPGLMQKFVSTYEDAETILLNYNYRNPKNIVETSSKLISKNINRFEKNIYSTSPLGGLFIKAFDDDYLEAKGVIEAISKLRKSGIDYGEIAILYRNHNDARYIVDGLINAKLPFYLKEQMPNIYTHFVIADIENYFQIAIGNSTKARLLSVMNRPNRYLHRRAVEYGNTLEGMLKFYSNTPSNFRQVEALINDIRLISKMSPAAAINYIKNVMGYRGFLQEEAVKNQVEVNEYVDVLDFLSGVLSDCKTLKQSIDKLNMLKLKVDYENKNRGGDKAGKIGLYTLHASKGLEFENVFIISANEGTLPTNKAVSKEDIEGERRLFYVGMTRTKKNLYLSYTNKKNRDKSRFLTELDYSSSMLSP
ncbi:ATP-dependent helicase [Pseudobutyrivibrio ruminis]|uniref:ATP-dependent helicase n=1 Tax=Pseudobutyrivibrio ruminis TaxID=46206 RepID=UPI0004068433|nr:ATP-dependent helicase [Pseudobutyrivibrio ruminis]